MPLGGVKQASVFVTGKASVSIRTFVPVGGAEVGRLQGLKLLVYEA